MCEILFPVKVSHKSTFIDFFLHTEKILGKLMIVRMDIANLPDNSNPLSRVSFDFRPYYPVLRKYEHCDAAARALVLLIIFKCRLTRGRCTPPFSPSLPQIPSHPRRPRMLLGVGLFSLQGLR